MVGTQHYSNLLGKKGGMGKGPMVTLRIFATCGGKKKRWGKIGMVAKKEGHGGAVTINGQSLVPSIPLFLLQV